MYKERSILALIPARGGSKGLPRKNIRPLSGKPLIAWTIEQSMKSKYLDRVIVNTEDKDIAKISKEYGAEVPFIRPKELARDEAKGIDVVLHTIEWFKGNRKEKQYDVLMYLQPTSPLRQFKDIDESIEYLFKKNAKAILSVCEVDHHPLWSNTLPEDKCMKDFIRKEIKNKNRQELPKYYRLNGAIYLAYCDYIKEQNGFLGYESFAYIMPKERSIDIDDEMDFRLASLLIKNRIKY
jgi:CMP-N,N'-diacetyllegionaminic acid synthase